MICTIRAQKENAHSSHADSLTLFDEIVGFAIERSEKIVEKAEIMLSIIFYFYHNVFQSIPKYCGKKDKNAECQRFLLYRFFLTLTFQMNTTYCSTFICSSDSAFRMDQYKI